MNWNFHTGSITEMGIYIFEGLDLDTPESWFHLCVELKLESRFLKKKKKTLKNFDNQSGFMPFLIPTQY